MGTERIVRVTRGRIQIVEDERIIALDLQRRLERFDYEVVGVASSAQDAVAAAEQKRPDLILMDIMLTGKPDGVDAAIQIRSRFHIPIVFLTAYADDTTLDRAKEAEPFGYILKPFKERELYTTIDIALYKARLDQALFQEKRRLSAVLDSVSNAIVATDREGNVDFMNPVAETLTGWAEPAARGRAVSEIVRIVDEKTGLDVGLPEVGKHTGRLFFDNTRLHNRHGASIHVQGAVTGIDGEESTEGLVFAFQDLTDMKRMSETITFQAHHDQLTGLLNRDRFVEILQEHAEGPSGNGQIHSFVYIDLDQFKLVNDVCGHVAGDELLRQVSASLKRVTGDPYVLGRLGGDEFGLLLPNRKLNEGLEAAKTIRQTLERKFIWQKNAFHITASIGLVPVAGVMGDVYAILTAADDACYLAKEQGGNGIKVYETTDHTFLRRRGEMHWVSRLTSALEENRFELYGQRIHPLRDGLLSKLEVLLRLIDEDGTLVSPLDFTTAAERYNLMPAIDRWVIQHAFDIVKHTDLSVDMFCINLSGASVADETLLPFIVRTFEETGLDPKRFCFEVTETAAIENLSHALNLMNSLRGLGCSFALDDFGNGFSSFAYLKNLPLDYLKIDGSFVRDIAQDAISHAMVEAVNRIGHVMGMRTIAEYVTDDRTRELLVELGVDYGQGFSLSRPAPIIVPD